MENDDSPLNIFRKSAKGEAASKLAPPPAVGVHNARQQTQAMADKMKTIQNSIAAELEKIAKVSGLSIDQIWSFVDNSSNFTHEQLEKSQSELKMLKEQVWSATAIIPADLNAALPTGPKEHRKTKFSGARRNWLSAR